MGTVISPKRLWEFVAAGSPVEFMELHPATSLLPAPPRFIFGTFGDQLARHYFRQAHLWSIGVYRLRGFDLFGPYILCRDGNVFFSPETNIHPQHIEEAVAALGSPAFAAPRQRVTGQAAMITGPGHRVYGHWLSDFLPKLYLLLALGYDVRRLRYLMPADTPSFGHVWLELLGIPAENIILFDSRQSLVWVEELLVPTILHNGLRASILLNNAAKCLLSLLEGRVGGSNDIGQRRRIFVSRARASQSRPLLNRDRIEDIARAAGLEIVHPESLSLADQVRLFNEASAIVGEYGSAVHGSLFSSAGTTVCNLRGSLLHPGFIQSGFGHVLHQPTGYVFGETDSHSGDGRFTVSETDFSECLSALFDTAGFEQS